MPTARCLMIAFLCFGSLLWAAEEPDLDSPVSVETEAANLSKDAPAQPGEDFERKPFGGDVAVVRSSISRGESGSPTDAGDVLARIFGYLVLLAALLVGAFWMVKRAFPGGKQMFSSPAMEVLGRTYLDNRRYLALVRVGARILVLGVTPDGVESLSEVSEGEEVAELLRTARPQREAGRSVFQSLLQGRLARQSTEVPTASGGELSGLGHETARIEAQLRRLRSEEA